MPRPARKEVVIRSSKRPIKVNPKVGIKVPPKVPLVLKMILPCLLLPRGVRGRQRVCPPCSIRPCSAMSGGAGCSTARDSQASQPTTTAAEFEKAGRMGPGRAVAALEHTISQGWTGIYEPQPQDPPRFNLFAGQKPSFAERQAAEFDRFLNSNGHVPRRPMTHTEFLSGMAYLAAGVGKVVVAEQCVPYWDLLGHLPYEVFQLAASHPSGRDGELSATGRRHPSPCLRRVHQATPRTGAASTPGA